MKQYRDYSVLGHLDLIVRDDPAGVFPFEKTESLTAEILKQAIQDGERDGAEYVFSSLWPERSAAIQIDSEALQGSRQKDHHDRVRFA